MREELDYSPHPRLTKGTAFMDAERAAFGLEGLLPPSVETIYQQKQRIIPHWFKIYH